VSQTFDPAGQLQTTTTSNGPAVASGQAHTLEVRQDGSVWAAGSNSYGQLAQPTTLTQSTYTVPVAVPASSAVTAGYLTSLALTRTGIVYAWGYGADGELGNGATSSSVTPVQVSRLSGVLQVSMNEAGGFALALKS